MKDAGRGQGTLDGLAASPPAPTVAPDKAANMSDTRAPPSAREPSLDERRRAWEELRRAMERRLAERLRSTPAPAAPANGADKQ